MVTGPACCSSTYYGHSVCFTCLILTAAPWGILLYRWRNWGSVQLSCPGSRALKVSEDCNTVLTGILNSGLSLYTWLLQTHLAPCGISGERRTQVLGKGVFLMFLSHITLVAVSSLRARLVPAPGSWDGLCESPRGENIVLGGLSKPIKFGGWCKLLPVSSLLAVFGNRDKVTW